MYDINTDAIVEHRPSNGSWNKSCLVLDIDRVAVVGPRSDLQGAQLLVEREELNVDRTETFVDGRWLPENQSGVVDRRLCHQLYREVTVGAAT